MDLVDNYYRWMEPAAVKLYDRLAVPGTRSADPLHR